jgi:Ca-activated chloride channel homolog
VTFQSPGWLWALLALPPAAAALVLWARSARRAASAWADPAVMAVGPGRRARALRTAAALVALLAVGAGAVGMARPSVQETAEETRSSVMLTIDVSDSMVKRDLEPNRLAAALDAARRFAEEAPASTSIGVTTFAWSNEVLLAPTLDRERLGQVLEGIGTDTRLGTALGDAMLTSLTALRASGAVPDVPPDDPSDSPGRILLLTDGVNSIRRATSPDAAAERIAVAGVPVYTILLGDDPGRPDQPLPEETLAAVATRTGGIFAQTTTTVDLRAVFADIGTIVAPVERLRELTVWVAVIAIALLLAAAALAGLARPRPPRRRVPEPSRAS